MAKSSFFVASAVFLLFLLPSCNADPAELSGELEANSKLFREYIGALFNGVKFTDVPINPRVKFHFILAFAIDYTTSESPTNGKFNIFWDKGTLTPAAVKAIKDKHKNVKVAVSLGGDKVGKSKVVFNPTSVSSWVNNAVASLTKIIKEYHLDGIDIDYEHFATSATPNIFASSIGQLIAKLKQQKVISFASIAPFDAVQKHYVALWSRHAKIINYVNFQFYTYPSSITVPEFIKRYNEKASLYKGGRVLVSFSTDSSGGLQPAKGFFNASRLLKKRGKLAGIFVWSADSSKVSPVKFRYEKEAQELLAAKSSEITFGFGEGDHEEQNIDLSSEITFAEGDDEEQNINLSSEIISAEGDDEEQNIDLSSEITFGEGNDEEQNIRLPSEITSAERDDEEQRIIL